MNRIVQLQQFLDKAPGDPFLNHAMALEYVKAGDEGNAQAYFEKNRSQAPGYVATYYHLGKLLERTGRADEAVKIYEEGMQAAKAAADQHSYNELQAAYEDLIY